MKRSTTLLLAAVLLCSCGGKETPPNPNPPAQEKVPIRISVTPSTKVTDTAYENGDIIGLWVVNSGSTFSNSGNYVDNQAFTFDGSQWSAATQLYWKDDKTNASFYCYYPRVGTVSDIKAIPFAVAEDQSTLAGYRASVLLWGSRQNVAPTSSPIEITTHHRMSNLLVYILPGNGYTAESLKEESIQIFLNGLKVKASLNAETGEVSATGNPVDINPYQEGDHFRALVPPQSLQDQTLVSLKVGDYSFSMKETITLKSNTQHKVTLTVNKVSEGINIGIGNWETDENDYGGTVN